MYSLEDLHLYHTNNYIIERFLSINIIVFVAASILSRSIRFFTIAFIIYKFGPTLMREFEGKLTLYSLLIAVILILFSVLLINFI